MEDIFYRQMPHSLEAEQSVLGSMLIDANCVKDVMEQLRPDDFYLKQNREIFETIYSMFVYSKPIDGVTVAGEMEKNGTYEESTTRPYLAQLMDVTPTSANVMEYVGIVRDKALLRALYTVAGEISTMVQDGTGGASSVLDAAEQKIYAVRRGRSAQSMASIGVVLQEIFRSAMITGCFQRVETDKFFRYNLQNKLLMLDDDMQMNALPSTGYIKNLVTAEIPIDIEAKGKQSRQTVLYSRFLCFGNGSPKALYDKSDGFARRLIVLTTKPIPQGRVNDPFLAEKFIAEKDKIFCWIFDGLKRLIKNDFRFTISEKTKRNIAEVMADNCNIIEYLADKRYISFPEDAQTSSTDLYGGYFHWCSENALTALRQETFIGWLRNNERRYNIRYVYHVPSRNGGHVRGFKGIKTSYVPIVA